MKNTALLVIDLQNEYLPTGKLPLTGIEEAAAQSARIIADARNKSMPVIHVRHEFDADSPFFVPGSDGVKIQDTVLPLDDEEVVVKNQINSFRDTNLKELLDKNEVKELVVIGAMSHMCVDAVVRAAVDLGYPTTVIHDACATLDLEFNGVKVPAAQAHATIMAAFEFAYATVKSTDDYLGANA